MLATGFDEGFVGTLHDAPAADVIQLPAVIWPYIASPLASSSLKCSRWPSAGPGWSWRSAHAVSFHGFEYAHRLSGLHQQGFIAFRFFSAFTIAS